jgi:hypothetical protein
MPQRRRFLRDGRGLRPEPPGLESGPPGFDVGALDVRLGLDFGAGRRTTG